MLARTARKGLNSNVFWEIFGRDGPALLRYLRRLTGSRVKAEDMLQETFLKLHVHLAEGAALDNPCAWLFRVATNLARDQAKAEIRAIWREQQYGAGAGPADFRQQFEYQQDVSRVLTRLSPRMRQVLLLQAEGFSYREMAEIASIESGYVGVLLQRARAEFKRVYEELNDYKQRYPSQRRVP